MGQIFLRIDLFVPLVCMTFVLSLFVYVQFSFPFGAINRVQLQLQLDLHGSEAFSQERRVDWVHDNIFTEGAPVLDAFTFEWFIVFGEFRNETNTKTY